MTIEEFKSEKNFLERQKIKVLCIDIETAKNLFELAKEKRQLDKFYNAFESAIGKNRYSNETDIYSTFFNEQNFKAYSKQLGQSQGGKKSKRTAAKPKTATNETEIKL